MAHSITIIGSRETPLDVLKILSKISVLLRVRGFIVRTGDAKGADMSARSPFEFINIPDKYKDFLYDDNLLEVYTANHFLTDTDSVRKQNIGNIVSTYHPYWNNMKDYSRALHCRNYYQIAGKDNPISSLAVLCWTPDGCEHHNDRNISTGGTGTCISLASEVFHIPVFNLKNGGRLEDFYSFVRCYTAV